MRSIYVDSTIGRNKVEEGKYIAESGAPESLERSSVVDQTFPQNHFSQSSVISANSLTSFLDLIPF